jgi:hypothetical protein
MKSEEIRQLLDSIKPQISDISSPALQVSFSALFNLVEFMFAENGMFLSLTVSVVLLNSLK